MESSQDAASAAPAKLKLTNLRGFATLDLELQGDTLRLVFKDGRLQDFELLSDGYRNLVALAADIAWRAVRLNPHQGVNAPAEASGVVLIDEIELHLHPAWQRTVLGQLVETFRGLQCVVTTHSPQVLASVAAQGDRFLARAVGSGSLTTPR